MFMSKNAKQMTVIVTDVLDNDFKGRALMETIIRRNCKVDYRLASQMVKRIRDREDGNQTYSDFEVMFEAYNMEGVVRDFDLLKVAGVIKRVEKEQVKTYLVY